MSPLVAAALDFRIGVDYPAPIVDHKASVAAAKDRLYGVRRNAEARDEAKGVYLKHGSRKPTAPRMRKKAAK